LKAPAASALKVGQPCRWDGDFLTSLVLVADTYSNVPVAFPIAYMAAGTYGWFGITGKFPAFSHTTVAVGAQVGIDTANGEIGTVANGLQILRCRLSAVNTATVTKRARSIAGSTKLFFEGGDDATGLFTGMSIVEVGGLAELPATDVSDISDDGKWITMTVAATLTSPAANALSPNALVVNFHYHNAAATDEWEVLHISRPHIQGQIV
jgi:hypothetical protein